jgi:hypothetical protein
VSEWPANHAGTFPPADASALKDAGWIVVRLPEGLTLAGLRAAGAPFKSTRYFTAHAPETVEHTTVATELAYRPALLLGSFNLPFPSAQRLAAELTEALPVDLVATIAPAAAYVWLFEHHRAAFGEYPFAQLYTWSVDRFRERANLVVGIFGRQRPIVVAPLVEERGGGVGVWPVVVPRTVASSLWPTAPRPASGK